MIPKIVQGIRRSIDTKLSRTIGRIFFKYKSRFRIGLFVALILLTLVRIHDRIFQCLVRFLKGLRHDISNSRQNHGHGRCTPDGRQAPAWQARKLHQALPLSKHGAHQGRHLFTVARRTWSNRLWWLLWINAWSGPGCEARIDRRGLPRFGVGVGLGLLCSVRVRSWRQCCHDVLTSRDSEVGRNRGHAADGYVVTNLVQGRFESVSESAGNVLENRRNFYF